MWQKMIQPQFFECMHMQSSNSFSFINFLKKTGITEGSNPFWRSTLVFMHMRIQKLFFAFKVLFARAILNISKTIYNCHSKYLKMFETIYWKQKPEFFSETRALCNRMHSCIFGCYFHFEMRLKYETNRNYGYHPIMDAMHFFRSTFVVALEIQWG